MTYVDLEPQSPRSLTPVDSNLHLHLLANNG